MWLDSLQHGGTTETTLRNLYVHETLTEHQSAQYSNKVSQTIYQPSGNIIIPFEITVNGHKEN